MKLLTLRAAVILLIAAVAALVVFGLTLAAGHSVPEAALAGLFAAGGSLPVLMSVISNESSDSRE